VLAGREILKTIRVQDSTCTEDVNLRSKIIHYASTHGANKDAVSAQHRDQLAAYDVKWSHGNFDTTIATAAANGRITIYDLNRSSVEIARLHEHSRQVHRIAFNPHQPAYLLSGSQDGTILLWDLRALGDERSARECHHWKKYQANSEGIRDVKWSPSDGVIFAVSTDNGTLQRWDFAKESAPSLKLHAHDKTCHAIDWHPSGRYIASGGADKLVKVWDFESNDRRMKPSWQIRTPQAVLTLKWRPGSAKDGTNLGEVQSSQIATSYDAKDPRIQVWDFQRPNIPFQELDKYDTPASDLVWHSENLLWSVGSTGTFTQNDMHLATKPSERRSVNVITTAPDGRIAFFSESRSRRLSTGNRTNSTVEGLSATVNDDERFSSSQSANEGSLEEKNLSTSLQKRRQRFVESRMNTSSQSTQVTVSPDKTKDEKHPLAPSFRSSQFAASGYVLGLFDADSFSYLAQNYKLPTKPFLNGQETNAHELILEAFEANAGFAEETNQFRLAQSWRILGQAAYHELLKRAQTSKELRLKDELPQKPDGASEAENLTKGDTTLIARTENLKATSRENLSSMPTPKSRPLQGLPALHFDSQQVRRTNSDHRRDDSITERLSSLPTATAEGSNSSQDLGSLAYSSEFGSSVKNENPDIHSIHPISSTTASFRDFPDLEQELLERRIAMSNYRAQPRTVLRLDNPFDSQPNLSVMPPLDRYNSNESFQWFSASIDSDNRSFPMDGSFEEQKSILSHTSSSQWDRVMQRKRSLSRTNDSGAGQKTPQVAMPSNQDHDHGNETNDNTNKASIPRNCPVKRPSFSQQSKIHSRGLGLEKAPVTKPSKVLFQSIDFTAPKNADFIQTPWSLFSLLPPLLHYHLNTLSDTQMPSILALWLSRLFPSAFSRRQITSYLSFYHSQLCSLQLDEPASNLRIFCNNVFPEVTESITRPDVASWYCRNCAKPLTGRDSTFCLTCKEYQGHCPICEDQFPLSDILSLSEAFDDSISLLWTWCQGCGHGGHSSCLTRWFTDLTVSEGACAVAGCNHDCVEGIRREAKVAEAERQKRKNRKSVVKDDWAIGESKAVERARDIVGAGAQVRKGSDMGNANPITKGSAAGSGRRVRLKMPVNEAIGRGG
jgi:WD repeat-containing protein 24